MNPTQQQDEPQRMTNFYATRIHYAARQSRWSLQWQSLCSTATGLLIDDDAAERVRRGRKSIDYDALPTCKFCERKAAQ